jgi:hypothetical protein
MNIQELRFNNWVLNGFGEPIQIKEIISEGNTSGYKVSTLQPIELTPEILRNSGFASSFTSDPQEPNASKVFELNEFKVHQQNENINEFEVYNFITHERIIVTGVHHLQNLYYFAFDTHQELNINL